MEGSVTNSAIAIKTRICYSCKQEKPLTCDFFNKASRHSCGFRRSCKECDRAYHRKYNRSLDGYITNALRQARRRANDKDLEFDLTPEWVLANTPSKCPVLGLELERGCTEKSRSPSIDRVDPSRGYTMDNCQIISQRANVLKNDANLEELRAVVSFLERTKISV